jgi:apolipoprotein N-acyltransferase
LRLLRGFWPAPIVAGALMWMSFAPVDAGWLNAVGWAVLFASMRLRRGERAGRQVLVAMLVLFLPGVSWIRPLVWPMWLVVAFWCAGWEAVWGRIAGRFLAKADAPDGGPRAAWIVVLPLSHLAADMARTLVLTGFPWLLAGYSGWRNPLLLGGADLIGVHGASLAILLLGAGLAECASRLAESRGAGGAARALAPAAAVWAALAAWTFGKPALVESKGPTLLLLQPNIPQQLKEDALQSGAERPTSATLWKAHEDLAAKGLEAAAQDGVKVDLVVWAETMAPVMAVRPFEMNVPMRTFVKGRDDKWTTSVAEAGRIVATSRGAETLAGVQSLGEGGKHGLLFNSVVLLDPTGRVRGFQDKQHLTPGGEYIPLRAFIPFRERLEAYLEEMIGALPDLQPGEAANVMTLRGGARVGVMICYESAYPEVARSFVREGADLLVNCSNYGWFAGTSEMRQALAICALRAAELRRPLVLSSNNGISAVVGPDGRVRGEATAADEPGNPIVFVPVCESTSPFAAIGEWGAWSLSVAGVVLCFVLARPVGRKAT